MMVIKSTKTPGIRYREHPDRKHGKQKDKYFFIRYTLNKKKKEEGVGWASEGWSEKKAATLLFDLKENIRLGRSPQTLAEMRAIGEKNKKIEEEKRKEEDSKKILFKEVFKKYIAQVKIDDTFKTFQNKRDRYRIWISPFIKEKTLLEIKKQDIEDIKENMLNAKRADDTIKKTISIITQIYKYAAEHELYFGNIPTTSVKTPNKDNKRSRYLTKEEAKKLLEELDKHSPQLHDMALISLYTGMRAGEIRKLKWENILWNTDRIHAKWRKNGGNDLLPRHQKVREVLERRKQQSDSDFIFNSGDGNMLKAISGTYKRIVDKLRFNKGITDETQKVVFHTLRHTYASWLVMSGVDLYTVQRLMGHKDIKMTQRYAHLAPEYLEKAVNSLESVI